MPRTNGKAERFIQTSLREWAELAKVPRAPARGKPAEGYAQPFHSSAERAGAMRAWIDTYNHSRPHSALCGKPPISRLVHQSPGPVIASVPKSIPSQRFGRAGGVKPRAATAPSGLGLTPTARAQAQ